MYLSRIAYVIAGAFMVEGIQIAHPAPIFLAIFFAVGAAITDTCMESQ